MPHGCRIVDHGLSMMTVPRNLFMASEINGQLNVHLTF